MTETDGALARAALRGDRSAFAELYDRRARWIRAICFDTTNDLHSAADLTQEVFLRAYSKLDSLREPERFAAWLTGIARQVCREWRRGRLRDRQVACSFPEDVEPAARRHEADPRLETLREALAKLPERERLSLQAFYLQGLDAEQARSVLGLSKSTFYRVLAKARERLAAIHRRVEVGS
ncbi:MAG TPA: sigma-70 family RNA polymerase sigma factor [Thermoguttaceae bacterium]|nr:sigma-70 family RNA polymerase sigma factor [Thermoguttaceae bacterium]